MVKVLARVLQTDGIIQRTLPGTGHDAALLLISANFASMLALWSC
jgi:hypothetical protein